MKTRFISIFPSAYRSFGGAVCAGMALLMASRAAVSGSIDDWTFTGIITQGLAGGPYQANVPYSVRFSVDTTRLSTTASGLYFPTLGYGLSAGSSGFSASSVGSGVLIANNQPASGGGTYDGIIFSMFGEQSTGFPSGTLFDGSAFGITLANHSAGPTATPFTDTSFPSTLDLNQFAQRNMTVYFQSGAVRGSVDDLYLNGVLISRVPEPGLPGFFALSGLLLGGEVVRRRKSHTSPERPIASAPGDH